MSSVRDFIITASENFYKVSKLNVDGKSEDILSDFIHNSPTLLQTFVDNNNQLHFYTQIQCNIQKSIVFYKNLPQDLTSNAAVDSINMTTLTANATESLYQILKQIYSPLLATGNSLYDNKLQKNISELESNLRALTHGKGGENVNVILSIEDEVDYWKSIGLKRDASKKEREAASAFCVLFEDISEEIRLMQSSPMQEIKESAENVGGILDDIWRYTSVPYPEERMVHVFDIVGHIICSIIQRIISGKQLWKISNGAKDNEILTLVNESLSVIQTWINVCKSLTETYWPNYALHTWNGKFYVPSFCLNLKNRILEIHDIRSTYNQLSKLLTKPEKDELKTDYLFETFDNVNVWIYNGPNQSWENAISIFSDNLRPTELKIAEKLKPRMRNSSTKQMFYEFMRYKTLINRPHVKEALRDELEVFASSLLTHLRTIKSQVSTDDVVVKMHQPPEMSPIIQQVQWAKQTEAKVKDIQACTEKYLSEFDGSTEVLKLASQVAKELKVLYTQLHEEWSRDLQAQVKDGSLQLCPDKPVVEFSGESGRMVVNFDPRLVRVEQEARALAAAGLPPPPAAAALHALTAVLQQARALQQVASFHNTLGERMIPSTRPLMLEAALQLSALVQRHEPVYWTDADRLAKYTDRLKDMLLKLEAQNTYLTSQHVAIRNIVEKLLDTELFAKQTEWKKKIKEIRDIIEKVEVNGYKNTEMWRAHWDVQLYKALECQYIKALLSLHTHFPHVKVDLILRGHAVRLQPPLEEVRAQHYHTLRRLVALPALLVGLSAQPTDQQSVFATIVHKHSWLGNKAVRQIESALSSVERVREAWTRRAALACVRDLDGLCARLAQPADWEDNFKACKAYGQTVAKMTFEDEKVEWISIGTAGLRRELEAVARQLWAALVASLQTSCRADADGIHSFMANAQLVLENITIPKNAKELADISAKQHAVQDKMPEMEQIVESLKKKGHMLRTWGGDPFVEDTVKEWQKIREQLASHRQMFEHQAEIVKSSLSGEWENLSSSVEAWCSRWGQARPRLEDTRGVLYTDMVDRCGSVFEAIDNLDKYLADRHDLIKECEKFSMKFDVSETWKEAETLKKEYVLLWTTLKEYNEDYDSIAKQEWVVFQKKLHLLDEFISKWSGKLEPYTSITLFLKQELDKYTDLTTALKYVRGSDLTERHWREVFGLLGMDYTKPETLLLEHFLAVATNMKKHLKQLQNIFSAASNEATIRSALNDLELWYAGARFAVVYHNDKGKRLTPIVKDFKEILNKIEEQQWVVSSLGGGTDACATWDARLRAARTFVRAAHHAQRRFVLLIIF